MQVLRTGSQESVTVVDSGVNQSPIQRASKIKNTANLPISGLALKKTIVQKVYIIYVSEKMCLSVKIFEILNICQLI